MLGFHEGRVLRVQCRLTRQRGLPPVLRLQPPSLVRRQAFFGTSHLSAPQSPPPYISLLFLPLHAVHGHFHHIPQSLSECLFFFRVNKDTEYLRLTFDLK